jgi:anti-sigma factor ChrR (cupin superfamily)
MKINADFEQRVVVHSARMPWLDSPMPGVSRRPLDRVGDEVARATSIVRYAPGSKFSPHVHAGGEEIVVLEGIFQDEHGDFPAGSYIRNPPQSSHTPGSSAGCVIFVKLWQFEPQDPTHVRLDSNFMQAIAATDHPGVSIIPLYMDQAESVSIHHWQPGVVVDIDLPGGAEFLILEGEFTEADEVLSSQAWLRLPCESKLHAIAGSLGAKVWVKQGHMNRVDQEVARLP